MKWHWKKVNKRIAEDRFCSYETVYLLPNKMRPDNIWCPPVGVNLESELTFDGAVNAFKFYNCNAECGTGVAYYLKEVERS